MPAKYSQKEVESFDRIIGALKVESANLSDIEFEQLGDSVGNVCLDIVNSSFSLKFDAMGLFTYPFEPGDNP